MYERKYNMRVQKLHLLTIILAVTIFAAGCAPAAAPQPTLPPAPTAAPTEAAMPAEPTAAPVNTSAPAATEPSSPSVPQTGPESGGLVVTIDPATSEARYRVREQLANRDLPNDAIGRTNAISGSVTIKADGTIDTASSQFTVDVSNLQSDASMRDNFVKRNVLQTSQFPNVTFVHTQVSGLAWPLPQSGPVTFQLTGDLTIRDVTKPVTWEVTGEIQDSQTGQATGAAVTSFTFADFNLTQPRVPSVLSIADTITLEVDITLRPAQ